MPEIAYHLGKALQALGRTEEAVAEYRKLAWLTKPDPRDSGRDAGTAQTAPGATDLALAAYREVVRLTPRPLTPGARTLTAKQTQQPTEAA